MGRMTDPYRNSRSPEWPAYEVCHCGEILAFGYDGDPTHHRGMCAHCDAARCDAYPGACHP